LLLVFFFLSVFLIQVQRIQQSVIEHTFPDQ